MDSTKHKKIGFVFPNYNDWISLQKLIELLENNAKCSYEYFIVDDCSHTPMDESKWDKKILEKVTTINLITNQGHQKAIAIGLSYLNSINYNAHVIVMDSDGEDTIEGVNKLIATSENSPQKIVFAKREKRSESFVFRAFYVIYKTLFKLLTGKAIFFGNFSILPFHALQNIVYSYDLWNHYAGAVLRSKQAFESVSVDRGKRLFGKSTMNFNSLVLHGLSAFSVFLDIVAIRVLLTSLILILACLGVIAVVIIKKYVTHIAIPGWASTLIASSFIIILQSLLISVVLIFFMLNQRTQKRVIPAQDILIFIREVKKYS